MSKNKIQYRCSACKGVTAKWNGQCPECEEWNTLEETVIIQAPKANVAKQGYAGGVSGDIVRLDQVATEKLMRMTTSVSEFDRVLGGGLVVGSSIVLGGNPGAGKSTLLLQTACILARTHNVLYSTGEESLAQMKDRAIRLDLPVNRLNVIAETDVVALGAIMERDRPNLLIVDSIQTLYHPDVGGDIGGVSQVRNCASYLTRCAKRLGVCVVMVGHINKSESLAGPMTLMHIVDAILMLSSTDDARYRIMRAEKNRFGDTSEIGVFAMTGTGIKAVDNPSAIFLSRAIEDATGSVVTPLWEGTRPMLIEVQALMDKTLAGFPRRVSVGLDDKRVAMLIAILGKHGGLNVSDQDVYINIVGGIKITETSADLPVLLAAVSSLKNKVIPSDTMVFGEVGLSGEVRPCANGQERIKEAVKLGFKKAIVPFGNFPRDGVVGMEIIPVATLAQAVDILNNI
jgi:DNA repair protein RadA/Sms